MINITEFQNTNWHFNREHKAFYRRKHNILHESNKYARIAQQRAEIHLKGQSQSNKKTVRNFPKGTEARSVPESSV